MDDEKFSVDQPQDVIQESGSPPKKEKPSKEKKVISKYYAGTNIEKLPKIPKAMLKDIDKLPVMTDKQIEQYLTAMALGLIPDKFGLEAGLETKLKALAELNKMKQFGQGAEEGDGSVVIVDDIDDESTDSED